MANNIEIQTAIDALAAEYAGSNHWKFIDDPGRGNVLVRIHRAALRVLGRQLLAGATLADVYGEWLDRWVHIRADSSAKDILVAYEACRDVGFPIGDDDIAEAIEDEGWTVVHEPETDVGVWLCQREDGSLVAVADVNGPWAVEVG